MRFLVLMLVMALSLSACATTPAPVETRSLAFEARPPQILEAGVAMLMERGYVVRFADVELGRVEAVSATWPGYRITLQVEPEGTASRVAFSGRRDRQPIASYHFDPLLVDLQARLGLAP
ncbi:hypothetical protein [Litchfieldella xinjiangensis]|uniref:hypothetical protein n=1 Tax=Litchfieldella xinjiangensis TaxID=1166948 RepID=UPI0005BAB42F|nr:hypothetical protein [Halomonas xinjiangensis]